MSERSYQLTLMPYLALGKQDEIRYGRLRVWPAERLEEFVESEALLERIRLLLRSYKAPYKRRGRPEPLSGVGIVSAGPSDFRPLVPKEWEEVEEFRDALFLAVLSSNVLWFGPNSGHYIRTAENFSLLSQTFQLTGEYLSERSGALVQVTNMGLKIGEVEFQTPTYVPRPLNFDFENAVLAGLWKLRRADRRLYRRILNATAVFLQSYYNTPAVDLRARVLLQATAFEVLLDLPDKAPRKHFKDEIERLCGNRGERKYRYKYEVRQVRIPESRTQKGIWADRFYALRNMIIHGESVPSSRYFYRKQHHLMIAPLFFVSAAKKLMMLSTSKSVAFFDRIDWKHSHSDNQDSDDERDGFRMQQDFGAMFEYGMREKGLIP